MLLVDDLSEFRWSGDEPERLTDGATSSFTTG
jgi:hypothetical protein